MENASKALLIAGAILIVLAIIAIGVSVFNNSKIFANRFTDQLTNSEIENHNNVFMIYDGKVTGSEVINACLKARQLNSEQEKIDMSIVVNVGTQYSFNDDNITQYDTILNTIASSYKTSVFQGNIIYNDKGLLDSIMFILQ